MTGPRKLHIKSYGCQMNVYDSHRMADMLAPEGFAETADAERRRSGHAQYLPYPRKGGREGLFRARPPARDEGRSGASRPQGHDRGRGLRRAGRGRRNPAPRAARSISWSDRRAITACRICSRRPRAASAPVDTEFPAEDKFDFLHRPTREAIRARGVTAFVTMQEGCDKFCTFCVVPYTRGAEVSRPVAKIVAEAERLADAGVREITLIGQNVNAYHGEGPDGSTWTLARLSVAARRNSRHRPAALHHQPSARRGRRSDRRASRSAELDAAICICRCSRAPTASSPR